MKVLVIGPQGQLGSDLFRVNETLQKPFHLIPVEKKILNLFEIGSISKILAQWQFDTLVNCSAYNRVDLVEEDSSGAFRINAHAVREMAAACHAQGARLIHVSTDYVFDGKNSQAYRESDLPFPINLYGASKLLGEAFASLENEDSLILRTASLFGISESSSKHGNFVESILKAAKEKGIVRVVNDVTMSPTGTYSLARILLDFIEKKPEKGIYHAVNSGQATWFEFAKAILDRTGVKSEMIPVTSKEYPTQAKRPTLSVLDNSKTAQIVGSIPHWKEALDHYLHAKGHLV